MQKLKSEKGQSLTEYLILTLLIAIGSITLVQGIGKAMKGKFTVIRDNINKVSADY